jgi:adenylate cyclase
MERAFGLYAGGILLDKIRSQHGEATLVASMREATVFFADIRGFSTMSERLSAPEILSILNRWFERVVTVVADHEGYLNKFIGDAVVVIFNGPVEQPDHPSRAVRCARALQAEASRMNDACRFPEIGRLEIGIGIATGPMICGNVGASERQMEYTVIGDTVNLASRLTAKAAPGEIWMSDVTAATLPAELKAEPLDPVQVKGKEKPVVPWRLLAA